MRGGERPRLVSLNLAPGSVQGANLRSSDYQNPLPDGAGHDRTPQPALRLRRRCDGTSAQLVTNHCQDAVCQAPIVTSSCREA